MKAGAALETANDFGVSLGHSAVRSTGVKPKSANHSEYMKALMGAYQGGFTVNPCPFGCEDDDLDEFGRCHHRIGVSPDGKLIEPEVRDAHGRVRVQVPYAKNAKGRMRPALAEVDPKRHRLVRVTTSYLVYDRLAERPEDFPVMEDTDDTYDDSEPEGDDDAG